MDVRAEEVTVYRHKVILGVFHDSSTADKR
jgi:hypothetical protein